MVNTEWIGLSEDYKDYLGFVYIIICRDKYYIGYKTIFRTEKLKPLKGTKRKRISVKERIDWMTYTGSNDLLNKDIGLGHLYSKHILLMCKNKTELQYFEAKMQFDLSVLYDKYSYNGQIRFRTSGRGLSIETAKKYDLALFNATSLIFDCRE